MSVYTVHEPPQRVTAAATERFIFVRDGFSVWAFLFGPLWMLWHRMWLVLLGYIVVFGGLEMLLRASRASDSALTVIGLLISLLIGLEAGTLRRFTLGRRGWRNVAVVSGDNVEHAERRFFDAWVRQQAASHPGAAAASPPPLPSSPWPGTSPPRMPRAPDVIGLFPEPGAGR